MEKEKLRCVASPIEWNVRYLSDGTLDFDDNVLAEMDIV